MKKIVFIVLFVFLYCIGNSQNTTTQNLGAPRTLVINKGGLKSDSALILPSFQDTASANLSQYVNYYAGNVIRVGDSIYYRNSTATKWVSISSGGSNGGKFASNIIMNAGAGNKLGYWVDGDTIPVAGLSLDAAFQVITQKVVHPTYTPPTVSISGLPSPGNYEIGDTIQLSLSKIYTQNDAGTDSITTFKRGLTTLSNNLDTIILTSATSYTVNVVYKQGACKLNNQGVIDCTNRISQGNITSSPITYTPLPKRYWGYTDTATPNGARIVQSFGGGSELSPIKAKGNFNITVTGTNKYIYYAYPISYGLLTSISVGGFDSFNAFNRTTVSVTNAQGYTQNYYVYTSQNKFNNTVVENIIVQ